MTSLIIQLKARFNPKKYLLGQKEPFLKENENIVDEKSLYYLNLANIISKISLLKEEAEYVEEMYNEYLYYLDYRGDNAVYDLLDALNDSSGGKVDYVLELATYPEKELVAYNIEAYKIDLDTFNIMKEYGSDASIYGNSQDYVFNFQIDPDLSMTYVPTCNKGTFEVSDNFTISGNRIDSNCDTWGTAYRAKAESLYAFIIDDIDKLAIVKVEYWCH